MGLRLFTVAATQILAFVELVQPAIHACLRAFRLPVVLVLAAQLGLCSAPPAVAAPSPEQEVFVTRGSGSPVFSDRPQSGAKPVRLPPINVVEPVSTSQALTNPRPAKEDGQPAPETPAYRSFRIVSPENNGSVAANSALFSVRVAVEPALQLGAGHAIMVSVNGQAVGQRFTASEFTIPPEFWGATLPPANQRQQLDATIVDRNGVVLEQAAPVTFILRYVVGGYQRPWHGPGYGPGHGPGHRPRPTPLPIEKPKPPPGQPFDAWERKFEQEGLRFYDPHEQPGRDKPRGEKPGAGDSR
ncbi:hypothetical protein [Accumulibacter sp.]|uniref:hypothetical protein n=1 Tax=Accumulibacter sp. TaxID=2053492 RepID=UPI002B88D33F|nr:hypothetical protein [Accumulibacter sp.]HRF04649.1 hypothetical protein [Accumulibacter sp.]